MSKLEVKKEMKKELEKVTDLNVKLTNSLESILNDYIDYIVKNVDEVYWSYFGIGVAVSHNQYGNRYGFINKRLSYNYHSDDDVYTVPGSGYYLANDYNAKVIGSNQEDMIVFAKLIPQLVTQGINKIKNENSNIEQSLEELKEKFN